MLRSFSERLKSVCKWTFAASAFLFIAAILSINFVFPVSHAGIIKAHSQKYGVDSSLVYAVIWTESKFDSGAVSSAGAVGLMQLMPQTAEWCAGQTGEEYTYENLFDADFNIKMGAFYLSYLIGKYGEKDAIAAYNAGEGNILLWEGEIRFKETRDFVSRVSAARKIYKFKQR